MAFGVQSIDRQVLKNNTVPKQLKHSIFLSPLPRLKLLWSYLSRTFRCISRCSIRTSMNSWDDQKVRDSLANVKKWLFQAYGLKCAITLWCHAWRRLWNLYGRGCFGSKEAHDYSMQRMIQAGVVLGSKSYLNGNVIGHTVIRSYGNCTRAFWCLWYGRWYTMVHKAPERTTSKHEVLFLQNKK